MGAEVRDIFHPENKKKQQKKGSLIILPDIMKAGEAVRVEDGTRCYSPNWNTSGTHADNRRFIEALTSTVCAVPVSSSLYFVCRL